MKRMVEVSFLGCKKIYKALEKINESNADYIHVDVVDGKFTKPKANPYRKLAKVAGKLSKRLGVHLMVKKPMKFIQKYATLNTEYIIIHAEIDDVDSLLDYIKSYGIKCGLAISPDTNIDILDDYLERLDLVLVMSIVPGKSGQTFMEEAYNRVFEIKKKIHYEKLNTKICVDGGINNETVKGLKYADLVVSATYVMNSDDINIAIDSLR